LKANRPDIYEIPWRPAYELYASVGWVVSAAAVAMVGGFNAYPVGITVASSLACLLPAATRFYQGREVWLRRKRMTSKGYTFMKLTELVEKVKKRPDDIWLGDGFNWTSAETQLLHDLKAQNPEKLLSPEMNEGGAQWLHGLAESLDLYERIKTFEGHTLIAGTPGSGKTRLYGMLIPQFILRGECVIVIDPKGDHDLRKILREACEFMGEPERYIEFHPAYPDTSARIDPIKNWNRVTEPASRIASLVPSETGSDPFTAFSWKVVNDIVAGLIMIEERPNLVWLRRMIEGGVDQLVEKAIRAYFNRFSTSWMEEAKPYIQSPSKKQSGELPGLVQFYKQVFQHKYHSMELDGIISSYEHNREHLQKMIASLIPIMSMLTSGPLKDLLSPSADPDDPRVLTDMAKVIRNKQVLYIGLDSLSDKVVGSAVGSIFLAELAAVAGDRYNYDFDAMKKPVNIFVDEASEVVNDPMIQILNKARGAGFRAFMATQTIADFAARLGDKDKARQVIANMNNNIILRLNDGESAEYIAEMFDKVPIKKMEVNYRSGVDSSIGEDEAGAYAEALKTEEVELFPPAMYKKLPDLNFIASMTGGKMLKGRIPIVHI
jgi:conjugal transfer pilus assembly protein TraD